MLLGFCQGNFLNSGVKGGQSSLSVLDEIKDEVMMNAHRLLTVKQHESRFLTHRWEPCNT